MKKLATSVFQVSYNTNSIYKSFLGHSKKKKDEHLNLEDKILQNKMTTDRDEASWEKVVQRARHLNN
jgi:hypothetical protein